MQFVFFFNDTATTEIYTLSLHDALPICGVVLGRLARVREPIREHAAVDESGERLEDPPRDQGPPRRERETGQRRSEEHTSELQSPCNLVCRLLLEKKKKTALRYSATVKV